MIRVGTYAAKALVAVSAGMMLCALPAAASSKKPIEKVAADKAAAAKGSEARRKLTTTAGVVTPLKAETLGSFTPPMLDNARRAGVAGASQERTFRFTPSGKSRDNKALALGVTSRVVRAAAPETARPAETEAATAYNFDVSVALRGFALTGGYSKIASVLSDEREGIDLGLSYRGSRWKTALQLNAERDADGWVNPLSLDKRYTVELGGAYALNPRLSVIGGVRYQMSESDPSGRYLLRSGERLGTEGEAGAVYLGTSFSF